MMLVTTSITQVYIYHSAISFPLLYMILVRMNEIFYPLKVFGRIGLLRNWCVDDPNIVTPALSGFRGYRITTLMTFCTVTQN